MAHLKMLSGLPASGKTTRAEEIVSLGNWIRVSRDSLRPMLHFGKFSNRNESLTIEAEIIIAGEMLRRGINVVVDDTNLGSKHVEMWRGVAGLTESKFSIEQIKTPYDECIVRDTDRENSVGADVIMRMAMEYFLVPPEDFGEGIILCDIDGTLADISHRLHHVEKEPKDWKSFFSEIGGDSLRLDTASIIRQFESAGYSVIFVTARPEDYREATRNFLTEYGFFSPLFMRRSGDKREDSVVKLDMYNRYFKQYPVHKVIDDRPKVIRMWREQGLEVIDVGDDIEF